MQLTITTASVADAHTVQTLHNWLVRTPGLDAEITQSSSARGHMGALDVIDVVLTHAVAVANLLMAFTAWRRTRPDAPPITFTANGITVTAADASPETVERIRATILAALPAPTPVPVPVPVPVPDPGDDAA